MNADELLSRLEGVRPRGSGKWMARCPAHQDKNPSLALTEGDKGLLLRCWAGCSLEDITRTLGLTVKDLFFDALSTDPYQRREAMRQRAEAKAARQTAHDAEGRRLDTLRQAEHLIQSARGISIEAWSDDKLNAELNRLGDAYALLDSEDQS
ncbi:MAG TPA: hypothetical protein VJT11_01805 [Nitrospiraceae bacterium]|nr:hypothetical protein [Nitrospiraceae bacterium]